MQHLNSTKVFALLLAAGLSTACAPAQGTAPNVARISFIQGSVQLMAGQGSDFQQAVMNMPIVDGSRLQAAGDGQAEVEFGDGSVARLTPNSTVLFDHLGQDQVHLQQLGGLAYYEFNVGDGHPLFAVQFGDVTVQPTDNSIFRIGLDGGWEVAVINGATQVQSDQFAPIPVPENQTIRAAVDNNGTPYTIAQGINNDSWDNWNQDRDQAIAQEAQQQTPVRDDSDTAQSENWNDLDADGNWYPVEGAGNVWVPAGVGAGWDPYGAGYWAYYPTLGYTWVSSYPWGWLPYHYGHWNYYAFGWGWAPGGPGRGWSPVAGVQLHPAGWSMPVRPVAPGGGLHPITGQQRLIAVNRGPVATGPWGFHGSSLSPRPDHQQSLSLNGRVVAPVERVGFAGQSFSAARGTAPGTRAVLSGAVSGGPRMPAHSPYVGAAAPRSTLAYPPSTLGGQRAVQGAPQRPSVGYGTPQNYNQRSTYVVQPTPTTHYSTPPQQQRYSAPPQQSQPQRYSPPPQQSQPQHYSAPEQSHPSSAGPRH